MNNLGAGLQVINKNINQKNTQKKPRQQDRNGTNTEVTRSMPIFLKFQDKYMLQ